MNIFRKILNFLPNDTIYRTEQNISITYMKRYYILKTKWFWIRIHEILNNDSGPFHDHPFNFISFIFSGGYKEITPNGSQIFKAPSIIYRKAESFHSLQLIKSPTWTFVIHGPKVKQWGFLTNNGWVYYRDYKPDQKDNGVIQ